MMQKKWLLWLNVTLSAFIGLLVIAAGSIAWSRPAEIPLPDIIESKFALPKNAFVLSKRAYDAIAETSLSLKFAPPAMLLPDLRSHLTYYGTNGRPDAFVDRTMLHFALTNNKLPASLVPGDRLYLLYDKKQTPGRYVFSPNNEETSLWIEAAQDKTDALVKVAMKNEHGEIIREPAPYADFTLPEKELARFNSSSNNWELGKWRVDGSLLARQRARWYGPDLFLENHGGEEFSSVQGKQRIDFGEDEEVYSCFVAPGDNLVWDGERWLEVAPGMDSRGKPLMHLKKVDERLINFELWDVEGKSRIVLNLIKSNDAWAPENVVNDFKFIGARTRTQCAFEVNAERMLLKPQDWLILTESGWVKLDTAEEIDDYVNRKITGTLFIFDGLVKKDDKQVLTGLIYNTSRTEMHEMEMAVQQSSVSVVPPVIENVNGKKLEQQAKVLIPQLLPSNRKI